MRNARRVAVGRMFLALGVVSIGWIFACPISVQAQTGNNAVYDSGGHCSPCASSPAFIDAGVFVSNATNFCGVLNYILDPSHGKLPSVGAVVDARGLNSGNTSMTCAASPWAGITSPPPSTILLPATASNAPIVIPSTWILPNNTRLIGVGDAIIPPTNAAAIGTIIQASSTFKSTPGPMIQFGSSTLCTSACYGIAVENLTLDGQSGAISGIVNQYAFPLCRSFRSLP